MYELRASVAEGGGEKGNLCLNLSLTSVHNLRPFLRKSSILALTKPHLYRQLPNIKK